MGQNFQKSGYRHKIGTVPVFNIKERLILRPILTNFHNQIWALKIRILADKIRAANHSMVEIGKSREIKAKGGHGPLLPPRHDATVFCSFSMTKVDKMSLTQKNFSQKMKNCRTQWNRAETNGSNEIQHNNEMKGEA